LGYWNCYNSTDQKLIAYQIEDYIYEETGIGRRGRQHEKDLTDQMAKQSKIRELERKVDKHSRSKLHEWIDIG
jgi:hypothetical protein